MISLSAETTTSCSAIVTKSRQVERKQHVEASDLCYNCLGRHKASECSSQKSYSSYGARHHSTLHDAYQASDGLKNIHAGHRSSIPPKITSDSDPVEILFGADVFADILLPGLRRGGCQEPVAQQTKLGWIISGTISATGSDKQVHSYQCQDDSNLFNLVQQFWTQEELLPTAALLSSNEQEIEAHYARTYYRTNSGRYVVRLPLIYLCQISENHVSRLLAFLVKWKQFARDDTFGRVTTTMKQYRSTRLIRSRMA